MNDECQMCHCEGAVINDFCLDCYIEMGAESNSAGQDFYEYWEIDDEDER